MFAFDRSALAVLAPIAMLLVVVAWSSRGAVATPEADAAPQAADATPRTGAMPRPEASDQTVAASLPSR